MTDTARVHIACTLSNYDTLCALGDEDEGFILTHPQDGKVTCPECIAVWKVARKIEITDISEEAV